MAQDHEKSTNLEKLDEAGAGAESTVSEGRRKAIKAGLIGAPLLLTLRGGPAWGDEAAAAVYAHSATPPAGQTTSQLDPQPTDDQGIDG